MLHQENFLNQGSEIASEATFWYYNLVPVATYSSHRSHLKQLNKAARNDCLYFSTQKGDANCLEDSIDPLLFSYVAIIWHASFHTLIAPPQFCVLLLRLMSYGKSTIQS